MSARRLSTLLAAIAALAWTTTSVHAQGDVTAQLDIDALLESADSGAAFELDMGDVSFLVEVERRSLLSEGFRATAINLDGERRVMPNASKTFRGHVVGDDESSVRLSFGRRGLFAYVRSGEDEYFIEPATQQTAQALALHKTTPAWEIPGQGTCACLTLDEDAYVSRDIREREPMSSQIALEAAGDRIVQIAIEADFEYWDSNGSDTVSSITDLMNVVEGIYETDLGITFEITQITYFEEDVDPYTSSDALTLLNQLQNNWNSNHDGVERDVVHLFTGRELDSTTVGIAFVGEVCDLGGAYGLSQDLGSSVLMPTLVAHELGHNFGAFHDPSADDPRYVMNPTLSSSTLQAFSESSQTEIANYVASVGCLAIDLGEDAGDGDEDPDSKTGGVGDTSGGGGGGPVDPVLLVIAAGALAAGRRRKRTVA